MSPTAVLLLALTLAVASVDWVAVSSGRKTLEYVTKPLTMVALIGAAAALEPISSAVRVAFIVALVFSLIGDIALMVPGNRFVAGLSAFLIAHVAYIIGLWMRGQNGAWFVIGLAAVVLAVAMIGLRIVRAVRSSADPALAGPVSAYIAVISLMVASAFGTRNMFAIAGASLFYASDTLIAHNRFIHSQRRGQLAIMVTYHLGQIGLVLSLV